MGTKVTNEGQLKQNNEVPAAPETGTAKTQASFTPTHEGLFLGLIPILWNEDENEIMGKNAVYDWLIPWAAAAWNGGATVVAFILPRFENRGFPLKLWRVIP